MLPRVDGLEVCRRVRADEHRSDHHADRPRRRGRQGARPRDRSGRLHHEAVLDPRVPEPRARASASRPALGAAGSRAETIEHDGLDDRSCPAHGRSARRAGPADVCRVRAAADPRCHPGRVYSRATLLEALWGSSDFRDPRTIDVHIRHLREKIERDPREPEYIFTVRGVGYRFRD